MEFVQPMPGRFKHFRARGIKFVFKHDAVDPELLHIYARHMTTPQDAAATFFAAQSTWDEENQRFETYSTTHGLFWFWLKENSGVMVISCFRI
jgi:hypothetical protein